MPYITIPPVFSSRNSPRPLLCDLLKHIPVQLILCSHIRTYRFRRESNWRDRIRVCYYKFTFTFVPGGKQLGGRSSSD